MEGGWSSGRRKKAADPPPPPPPRSPTLSRRTSGKLGEKLDERRKTFRLFDINPRLVRDPSFRFRRFPLPFASFSTLNCDFSHFRLRRTLY